MSLVSFVKIENPAELKDGILHSLNLINFKFQTNIRNVVIKPNLCYYWDYTTGRTTDPKFVAALIDLIREKISPDVAISIVESDASAMKCKHAFRMLGYEKLAQEYDVNLVNLCEVQSDPVEVTAGNESFRFMLPRIIRDSDLRINIPKIKYTFEQIKMTCALKNIFGCNPYPKKSKYHSRIEEAIVALNKVMKFNLCIVDGNVVSGAKPRRMGLIMSSRDPVAVDAAAARIAGIGHRRVRYISLAAEEGLGNPAFVSRGISLSYFESLYPRKTIKARLKGKAITLITEMGLSKRLGLA